MNKLFRKSGKPEDDLKSIGFSITHEIGSGTYAKVYRGSRDTFGGGNGIEQGTNVAVKVINRKTAPVSFLKKFLPRELDVARKLGMALSLIEISASSAIYGLASYGLAIYGLVSALLNSYIVKNH